VSKIGKDIIAGLDDAIAYAEGDRTRGREHVVSAPEVVDVGAIRHRSGLTQKAFAARYGFALGSLRNWEQGHRRPDGPARMLLTIIDREPEAVQRALATMGGD
jgi:putative transcriptional regulator